MSRSYTCQAEKMKYAQNVLYSATVYRFHTCTRRKPNMLRRYCRVQPCTNIHMYRLKIEVVPLDSLSIFEFTRVIRVSVGHACQHVVVEFQQLRCTDRRGTQRSDRPASRELLPSSTAASPLRKAQELRPRRGPEVQSARRK